MSTNSNGATKHTHTEVRSTSDEETPLLRPPERYSAFTDRQKKYIIMTAALASTFSPFSANIYYPALNSIAADLHISASLINLTIMTYMIFQGLAPTITASLSDTTGRRPIYLLCFTLYITANVALALQHSFPALLLLRALQSSGSSGTVALAAAVAADLVTSAERGRYMGLASLGSIMGPTLAPVVGGMLSHWFGWRSIFWFLAVFAMTVAVPMAIAFPETGRNVVGDGSGMSKTWGWWGMSLLAWRRERKQRRLMALIEHDEEDGEGEGSFVGGADMSDDNNNDDGGGKKKNKMGKGKGKGSWTAIGKPLTTLRLLTELPTGLILLANGLLFAGYYLITSSVPSQLHEIYDVNDLQVGLIFIAPGLGTPMGAWLNGYLVDWNFRRVARMEKLKKGDISVDDDEVASGVVKKKRQEKQDLSHFPIEKARLQVALPMLYTGALTLLLYAFALHLAPPPPLAIPITLLFFLGFAVTACFNVLNVLIVDLNYNTPATATAANNLVRCFLGAGFTALVHPALNRFGRGWTYAGLAGVWVGLVGPLLGMVGLWGQRWRGRKGEGKV